MQPIRLTHFFVCLIIGLAAGAIGLPPTPAQAEDPGLGTTWNAGPPFAGKKKIRKSISGAACALGTPRVCIVALDEGLNTQFFTIDNKTLKPGAVMQLLPKHDGGLKYKEIDAEGAAYADGYFYVMGSHGGKREDGEFRSARFFMFRFPVDKTTGKPAFTVSTDAVAPQIARSHILRGIIKNAGGEIGEYAEKPLGEKDGGVNLEGLAVVGKRIYLGFRGPSKNGQAYIMAVNVDGVFGSGDLAPVVKTVELGKDTGIRDLAAVANGLLILAGPVQKTGTYAIHHWDPQTGARKPLQKLTMPTNEAKAETLLVLGQSSDSYDVLVMYDGIKDGGPREYQVPR